MNQGPNILNVNSRPHVLQPNETMHSPTASDPNKIHDNMFAIASIIEFTMVDKDRTVLSLNGSSLWDWAWQFILIASIAQGMVSRSASVNNISLNEAKSCQVHFSPPNCLIDHFPCVFVESLRAKLKVRLNKECETRSHCLNYICARSSWMRSCGDT